jgi:hypothetical protein
MLSADAPRKQIGYEKPREPEGDYLKIEIRGRLTVDEWRAEVRKRNTKAGESVPSDTIRARIFPQVMGMPGMPGMPGFGSIWELSLDGEKELQDVVRKLKDKKVTVRGIARQTPIPSGPGGVTLFRVEVTSLKEASPKR